MLDLEGSPFIFCPLPHVVLLEEIMEWSGYIGEGCYPSPMEVYESDELPNATDQCQFLPFHLLVDTAEH